MKRTAEDYISLGWSPIPLVKGEKNPTDRKWAAKKFKPEQFSLDSNIGVHCGEQGGWRVDVDCDVPEAIKAAALMLPVTLMHGRPAKPNSHLWYHCVGAQSRQYKDDVMLVELRASGQTMIPPSTHPSGDVLAWGNSLKVLDIEPSVLEPAVRDVAIVTFIARHWSQLDHESMLHLAGMLIRSGIQPRMLFAFAAQICSPSESAEVEKIAANTVALFNAGRPVTGGRKLATVLGVQPVSRLRSIIGGEDIDALEEMNERHFFVRMGKDSVIGREDDPDEIVFQQPRALTAEYANRMMQVGTSKDGSPIYEHMFLGWMKHPLRRSYSKVVFAPPPLTAREDEYNLWKGFSVQPSREAFIAGRCLRILQHIREIICDGDPERTEYLLNLLARTVQSPGEALGISINMRGEQGSGKGVFVEYVGSLFHRHHYSHLTNMDQAIGRFNKAILGKIVIFLDEAAAEAAMRNHGTFKSLTTDKTIQIELKGVDTNEVWNLAHVFTATNDEKGVPTGEGDRRGFYLGVSNRYAYQRCTPDKRKAYFDALYAEMSSEDSKAALLYFLQQRNLARFDRFDKVVTDEELNQRKQSLKGPMRWLYDVVELGQIPTAVRNDINVSALYELYTQWSQRHGEKPIGPGPWGKVVAKYLYVDGESRSTTRQGQEIRLADLVTIDELRLALPPLDNFNGSTITLVRRTSEGLVDQTISSTTATTATRPVTVTDEDDLPF